LSVSFLGLNSSFDSAALVQQLVDLDTQNKIRPLENKKLTLQRERDYLSGMQSNISSLSSTLDISNIIKGNVELFPRSVTSTDTEKKYLDISTTDSAVPQSFSVSVSKLATNTVRKSASPLSIGVTGTSIMDSASYKNGVKLKAGTVTINGTTLDFSPTSGTGTKIESASPASLGITGLSKLDQLTFTSSSSLTGGTVTLNGETLTYTVDPALDDLDSMISFLNSFSGITASYNDGHIDLSGLTSIGDSSDSSNLLPLVGLSGATISGGNASSSKNLDAPRNSDTLASFGINGTVITVNGIDINFDPATDTISTLLTSINSNSAADVTASYNSSTGEMSIVNKTLGPNPLTISSLDSNIINSFDLADTTLGGGDDIDTLLTFFSGFAGVSANLVSGRIELSGITSIGGAGDTSNLIYGLGLDNSSINAGLARGLQNIDAPKGSSKLSDLGINGTKLTINGTEISFDPNLDTVNDLIKSINTSPATKISAAFDALNGEIVFTNDDTGALSLTVGSSDSNIVNQLNLTDEVLGDNAEFSISTLNAGATLTSNDNSVSGLIEGVTIELKDITSSPVNVVIGEDKAAYQDRLKGVLDQVNSIIKNLDANGSSFSRSLSQQIRSKITTYFSASTNDTYKSIISIGISSSLDGENKFAGYSIDSSTFEEALATDPSAVHSLLYGSPDADSVIDPMDDGSSGILVLLNDLLESYVDPDVPSNGILYQVSDSVSSQISRTDDSIERTQDSIDAMEKRLRAQFANLDVAMAEMQRQQSELSGLISQLG
jgi:flagellar capping protein FliD